VGPGTKLSLNPGFAGHRAREREREQYLICRLLLELALVYSSYPCHLSSTIQQSFPATWFLDSIIQLYPSPTQTPPGYSRASASAIFLVSTFRAANNTSSTWQLHQPFVAKRPAPRTSTAFSVQNNLFRNPDHELPV
jgi:hypothetical protein